MKNWRVVISYTYGLVFSSRRTAVWKSIKAKNREQAIEEAIELCKFGDFRARDFDVQSVEIWPE